MKKRLDILITEKGLTQSRESAKALIMSGIVYVNGQKCDKAGDTFEESEQIEIRGNTLKYVSRGGLKLEKALKVFPIDLKNKACCDFGASTGGFTDCMLQNGAKFVYAFDVGYGQLAWKLRNDSRVKNYERTNIRYLNGSEIESPVDFISIDVSFISLTLILPVAFNFLKDNGQCVALIKPQFEAGRENVGKKGVVRDKTVHKDVIEKIEKFAFDLGFSIMDLSYSPIHGPEGNIEYLIYLCKDGKNEDKINKEIISNLVEESHESGNIN